MKKRLLLLLLSTGILMPALFAQSESKPRIHEIGLSFYNLNAFGIRYKTGTERDMFRLSTYYGHISSGQTNVEDSDDADVKSSTANIGVHLGYEHRIGLVKNFQFLIGPDAGGSYGWNKNVVGDNNTEQTQQTISAGIALILGFNWNIREFLSLSAEILPGVSYISSTYKEKDDKNKRTVNEFQFGFSNQPASVTIAYRIHRKAK